MAIKILFLFTFTALAHLPSVQNLPRDLSYFSFYYTTFSEWFNNEVYSWSSVLPKNISYNHWYDQNSSIRRNNILWGVGWDPIKKEIFYTLSFKDGEYFKHFSTIPDDNCTEKNNITICPNNDFNLTIESENILFSESFPMTRDGYFFFKEFSIQLYTYRETKTNNVYRAFYKLNQIQTNWLPKELLKIVNMICYNSTLPVDKLSIDKQGRVIVYFP